MAKEKTTAQAYNNQSITSLKGADRVRKRPAVIFGSDGLEGCEHSFFEILSNSVDEAREGYGHDIIVRVFQDKSITVEDFGRGVPLGWNEAEKKYNWELVYCELYAGGKYDNNNDGSAYEFSLGLNGLGACATQYSSEFMDVTSYNGTTVSEIHFKKGNPTRQKLIEREAVDKADKRTGTVQHWRPDLDVFTDISIPREFFEDTLRKQAVVNAGTKFHLYYEEENHSVTKTEYYYENGIAEYIAELAGPTALTQPMILKMSERTGRDREDKKDYRLRAEIAFCCSNTVNVLEYYHNSSFLEHGGSPEKAVKTAFTYAVDKRLKALNKYNKNESRVSFQDIQDCLILVTNSFSTQTSYANQTKKAITNTFIAEALTDYLKEQLDFYFLEKPLEAEKFLSQILINKRSRESAEQARITVKKKLTGSMDISNRVEKFHNCRTKDSEMRELYIVEGDSAMSSCILARNAEFQAIMPVRGKTLNCLKATYERIFKSDIITDLIKVIGCGVEIKGKVKGDVPAFDFASLRWNKIIICTDADEDGFQIRVLLLTLFYRLLPTLIEEGRIYIAESPLYEITTKTDTFFAYNEPEKADIVRDLEAKKEKYSLQRSKGLGENEPEMMSRTTMDPRSRRLIRVCMADVEETARMFDTLPGDDLEARKIFISEHGKEYLDLADI